MIEVDETPETVWVCPKCGSKLKGIGECQDLKICRDCFEESIKEANDD